MLGLCCTGGGCWSNRQVSNWIKSSGLTSRLRTEKLDNDGPAVGQHIGRWRTPLKYGLLLAVLVSQLGHARDRGQFAGSNLEITAKAG
jgi:hypothetical protein